MGYLYVIQAGQEDYYKIGVTNANPEQRLKELQTGNHLTLSIKYLWTSTVYYSIEKIVHAALTPYKSTGEWFYVPFNIIYSKIESLKVILDGYDNVQVNEEPTNIELVDDFQNKVSSLYEQGMSVSKILISMGYTSGTNYTKYKSIIENILGIHDNTSIKIANTVDKTAIISEYICNSCGYAAKNQNALNGHMYKHKGDK